MSHETIYQSLFIQGRGELRRETGPMPPQSLLVAFPPEGIVTMRGDGSDRLVVVADPRAFDPSLSPDGSAVAYRVAVNEPTTPERIGVSRVSDAWSGHDLTGDGLAGFPDWSPTGDLIAFGAAVESRWFVPMARAGSSSGSTVKTRPGRPTAPGLPTTAGSTRTRSTWPTPTAGTLGTSPCPRRGGAGRLVTRRRADRVRSPRRGLGRPVDHGRRRHEPQRGDGDRGVVPAVAPGPTLAVRWTGLHRRRAGRPVRGRGRRL